MLSADVKKNQVVFSAEGSEIDLLSEISLLNLALVRQLSEKMNTTPQTCFSMVSKIVSRYIKKYPDLTTEATKSEPALHREPVDEP